MSGSDRLSKLQAIAAGVAVVLLVKVMISILLEYRWYFPADFDSSAFLSGRRATFDGIYRTAFYAHILSGPPAIVIGAFMMLSGGRPQYQSLHRVAGRLQILLVLAVVVPSGLVMAQQAYAGPIAAAGFASLALATGGCALAAVTYARAKKIRLHRKWASRCFLLLASVLLLRVIAGAAIVTQLESEWTYRLNAWLSWLVPLVTYEIWQRASGSGHGALQSQVSQPTPVSHY